MCIYLFLFDALLPHAARCVCGKLHSRIPSVGFVCAQRRTFAIIKFVPWRRRCAGADTHRKRKRNIKNALNVNKLDEWDGEHRAEVEGGMEARKSKRKFHFVQNAIFSQQNEQVSICTYRQSDIVEYSIHGVAAAHNTIAVFARAYLSQPHTNTYNNVRVGVAQRTHVEVQLIFAESDELFIIACPLLIASK